MFTSLNTYRGISTYYLDHNLIFMTVDNVLYDNLTDRYSVISYQTGGGDIYALSYSNKISLYIPQLDHLMFCTVSNAAPLISQSYPVWLL